MRNSTFRIALGVLPLFASQSLVSSASAENWVQTPFHLTVDVDSIRKDQDGLVHYRERHINLIYRKAFDCARRVSYFVEDGQPWKSRGHSVKSGTIGAEAMNFVCGRVR